jgi:hypothetical protein
MNIFKVGDTQKAICNACKSLGNATFALRDVPLSDGSGVVRKVLVGVCDKCDQVVLTPQQSVPAIKKQLDMQKKPIEICVPAHMIDMLNLASVELGGSTDFSLVLVKYYLHVLSHEDDTARGLVKYLKTDLAKGPAPKRISLKGRKVHDEVNAIKATTNIGSTTEVVKAIILKINDDIFIHPKKKLINNLKGVAAASA